MILALEVEIYRVDDLWDDNDLVFVNDFWASSRLCTLTISTSALEMCWIDDF
jgi:hypothetical protein